jgi:hypothetical protein
MSRNSSTVKPTRMTRTGPEDETYPRIDRGRVPQLSALPGDNPQERHLVPDLPPHAAGQFLRRRTAIQADDVSTFG